MYRFWGPTPDAFYFRQSRSERLVRFPARHQPGLQISSVRNGYAAHAPVQRVVFVQLDFLWGGKRGQTMRCDRGGAPRQEETQSANRLSARTMARAVAPDPPERQDAVDRRGIFFRDRAPHGVTVGAAMQKAARVL